MSRCVQLLRSRVALHILSCLPQGQRKHRKIASAKESKLRLWSEKCNSSDKRKQSVAFKDGRKQNDLPHVCNLQVDDGSVDVSDMDVDRILSFSQGTTLRGWRRNCKRPAWKLQSPGSHGTQQNSTNNFIITDKEYIWSINVYPPTPR